MSLFDGTSSTAQASRGVRRRAWRLMCTLLGANVTNGASVGVTVAIAAVAAYLVGGLAAASAAGVGVLVSTFGDLPAQKRRKFQQMLPGPALGAPLFLSIQLAHDDPWQQGAVLVCGTFVAFLGMAWGKRGGPVSVGMVFSMLFSMATPSPAGALQALERTGWFAGGALLYLVLAVGANSLLNLRYRNQLLAETLIAFAATLRIQARRFLLHRRSPQGLMAEMLAAQAALADVLQSTRDVVLEAPTRPHRQKPAGMLVALLEARDHLIACELDLDALGPAPPADAVAMQNLGAQLMACAHHAERVATQLLVGPRITRWWPAAAHRATALVPAAAAIGAVTDAPPEEPAMRDLADRVDEIATELGRMEAIGAGVEPPDLTAVRENWQLFISPVLWSWKPLQGHSGFKAPPLRQALRAAGAIGSGFALSLGLPWAGHKYWILVTIAAVMRANLAQTVERRNARVVGTLVGCGLVTLILATHPRPGAILATIAVAVAISHAFIVRRYLITSIAATTLGLLQAHLLLAGESTRFVTLERIADTLVGAAVAWVFSYVLPVWERGQVPALVRRTLAAQAQHAQLALRSAVDADKADVRWRLARREAYDSLAALVQTSQRVLSEPASVRPPLEALETLQALSYQLLAHLAAVKSLLQVRRTQLNMAQIEPAMARTAATIVAMTQETRSPQEPPATTGDADPSDLRPPDVLAADLTPWLLARLLRIETVSRRMGDAATAAALG